MSFNYYVINSKPNISLFYRIFCCCQISFPLFIWRRFVPFSWKLHLFNLFLNKNLSSLNQTENRKQKSLFFYYAPFQISDIIRQLPLSKFSSDYCLSQHTLFFLQRMSFIYLWVDNMSSAKVLQILIPPHLERTISLINCINKRFQWVADLSNLGYLVSNMDLIFLYLRQELYICDIFLMIIVYKNV